MEFARRMTLWQQSQPTQTCLGDDPLLRLILKSVMSPSDPNQHVMTVSRWSLPQTMRVATGVYNLVADGVAGNTQRKLVDAVCSAFRLSWSLCIQLRAI